MTRHLAESSHEKMPSSGTAKEQARKAAISAARLQVAVSTLKPNFLLYFTILVTPTGLEPVFSP